jgi:uncharacterized protein YndB with AHSA1/START domain
VVSGDYLEIEPPFRVVSTEGYVEGSDTLKGTQVITLEERDGRTYMSIVLSFASKQMREDALATGMEDGASIVYDQMEAYLKTIA